MTPTIDSIALDIRANPDALLSDRVLGFALSLDAVEFERFRKKLSDGYVSTSDLRAFVRAFEARGKEQASARREALSAGSRDVRPLIATGPNLHEDIAASLDALASDEELYRANGKLVRVIQCDGGEPQIVEHTTATMRARLTEFAHFQGYSPAKMEYTDILPPDPVTNAILDLGKWPTIRRLSGVIESPTMRPDGTVIDASGHDAATGFLYMPAIDFPPVPESPTWDLCNEELRFAWVELCHDFPYRGMGYPEPNPADPDGILRFAKARACPDAWGVIAACMTVLARLAILGDAPATVYDASGPGSGKGLQLDLVGIVTLGRTPAKVQWPASRDPAERDDEVRKIMSGEAQSTPPIVAWDEITGAFGGPQINMALTCKGRMKVRILGTSNTPTVAWLFTMLGAGNNVSARDNTHRRMLLPRLEPTCEDPQTRTGWRHENVAAWALENRGRLVCALLTVLRGYIAAGRPDVGLPTWGGGFESWSELVPRAIVWAGGGDVLGCRPTSDPDARNEEREAMAVLMGAIWKMQGDSGRGLTAKTIVDALYPRLMPGERPPPDGLDDAREAIEELTECGRRRPDTKDLGDKLKTWKRRPCGPFRLDVLPKQDREGVARWIVRK